MPVYVYIYSHSCFVVLSQTSFYPALTLPLRLALRPLFTYSVHKFHDGLGFLTNHAVISNTFEYSLQKVNPKLTLPYWDFTIETSTAGGSEDGVVNQPQTRTPLFQESWFGSVDHTDDMVRRGFRVFLERVYVREKFFWDTLVPAVYVLCLSDGRDML